MEQLELLMWNSTNPDNFDRFTPSDMPEFLEWWEQQHENAIALQLSDAFVEGVVYPYLELIDKDDAPGWIRSLLRWRLAAQWVYQSGMPLANKVARGIPALLPFMDAESFPSIYRITPKEIAEMPPQIRQGFLEGVRFSLSWVKRLSDDNRSQIADILAVNTLKNRNPASAVHLLEQVLRQGAIKELNAENIKPEDIEKWIKEAEFSVLERLAKRAELIALTESARMQNMGILSALATQGETLCYVMPHRGTCPDCRRLIDGRVFRVETLRQNLFTNIGAKKDKWKPALPQHPRCRHSPMEVPYQWRSTLQDYPISDRGVVLEWYGLPGGRKAFESLGLDRVPWLQKNGKIA